MLIFSLMVHTTVLDNQVVFSGQHSPNKLKRNVVLLWKSRFSQEWCHLLDHCWKYWGWQVEEEENTADSQEHLSSFALVGHGYWSWIAMASQPANFECIKQLITGWLLACCLTKKERNLCGVITCNVINLDQAVPQAYSWLASRWLE